jgi:hypothetical protein
MMATLQHVIAFSSVPLLDSVDGCAPHFAGAAYPGDRTNRVIKKTPNIEQLPDIEVRLEIKNGRF